MAERRNYGQFCGFATALDLLGERWTLLIVRELLLGPRRFSELAENLPGLGPNLLTDRLRALTKNGVIARSVVEGDRRGKAYELTPAGESLREPVLELARWGLAYAEPNAGGETRADWAVLAVQALMRPDAVLTVDENYEFHVDDQVFHIAIEAGRARVGRGPAVEPVLHLVTDARTFVEIGSGAISPFRAVLSERLKMIGDPEAVARCGDLLGLGS
ncbi:winged helix-turn-helix transcriptional regulator [Amycolatopsis sp. NBC_00345]|uniref:winged helix-turn-helix transcriptional regulator n=1 Tax=Amycolatopsis sp. NBC_00345 TaxID=2975955 RepID=UPI002E2571AC